MMTAKRFENGRSQADAMATQPINKEFLRAGRKEGDLRRKIITSRVSVPAELRNTAAQRFWEKLGFGYSDCVEDGYVFMKLTL
ncbi:MAG: hypothetical protein HFH91_18625 [Lachnospiraceae bacterium]|nr:hypothetical protein [Lachnospiraceae bacterium]